MRNLKSKLKIKIITKIIKYFEYFLNIKDLKNCKSIDDFDIKNNHSNEIDYNFHLIFIMKIKILLIELCSFEESIILYFHAKFP